MSARDDAIAAGNAAIKARYGYEPAGGRPGDAYWVHALDAIPYDVLVNLAVEARGEDFVTETVGLTAETRAYMAGLLARDAERIRRQALEPNRTSVVANAIGYEMLRHDGRPTTVNAAGVDEIQVSDEEAMRCQAAAQRVLDHLEVFDAG